MNQVSTVLRSFLSPEYLSSIIEGDYDPLFPENMKGLKFGGSNDIYRFESSQTKKKYVVKVYSPRPCWIYEESHYLFELGLQKYLAEKGIGVADPVANGKGKLLSRIDTPEGKKFYAVYSFCEGTKWNHKCGDERRLEMLGKALANLHRVLESFQHDDQHRKLDISGLLELSWKRICNKGCLPSASIKAKLNKVYDRIAFLVEREGLRDNKLMLIHGDMHAGNHLIHQTKNKVYFLDFELSCYGYLAYEFATMKWDLHHSHEEFFVNKCMDEFLDGYSSIRPIGQKVLDQIDGFVLLRQFFILGSSFLFYPDRPHLNSERMLEYYLQTFEKFLKITSRSCPCNIVSPIV